MFNLLIFSEYSIGNRVITKDGFIGVIEAKRRRYSGDIEYLIEGTSLSKGYGNHHWYDEDNIADKLSKAQEALFDKIFSGIKEAKDDIQWKHNINKDTIDMLRNTILSLNERLSKLEKAKEDNNEDNV